MNKKFQFNIIIEANIDLHEGTSNNEAMKMLKDEIQSNIEDINSIDMNGKLCWFDVKKINIE